MKIYKEYIPISPNTPIYTDIQGKLLTMEAQGFSVVAYFDADSEENHKYIIYMAETGKEASLPDYQYFRTLMMFNGDYVLHIFIKEVE